MSEKFARWARAAVWVGGTAYVLLPIATGWLSAAHVECSYCLGEGLRHSAAVFGYLVLGGYLLSFSRPTRPVDWRQDESPKTVYRDDFRAKWVWFSLVLSVLSFVTGFNWGLFLL